MRCKSHKDLHVVSMCKSSMKKKRRRHRNCLLMRSTLPLTALCIDEKYKKKKFVNSNRKLLKSELPDLRRSYFWDEMNRMRIFLLFHCIEIRICTHKFCLHSRCRVKVKEKCERRTRIKINPGGNLKRFFSFWL